MTAVKQDVELMIKNLPDDCTYEDIQYHLYVREKIQKGCQRAKDGKVSTHEEARERMSKWLSN